MTYDISQVIQTEEFVHYRQLELHVKHIRLESLYIELGQANIH